MLPEPSRAPVGPPALIYVHSEPSHSSRENLRPEISALTPSTHSVTSTVYPGTRDVSICEPPSLRTHLSWLKAPATPEAGPPASYVRLFLCSPQSLESQVQLFFPALSSERRLFRKSSLMPHPSSSHLFLCCESDFQLSSESVGSMSQQPRAVRQASGSRTFVNE